MLTFVTFLLLCYSAVVCNPHGVFWTIVDKHVTIGHDLNLYCNESWLAAMNCCPKNSTRRWFGGPDRKLLYKNGRSFYPSKYTSRLEDGGFYLRIHDVEEKDLNVSYACSVKIYEYTAILLPNYDTAESSLSTEISISTKPSISGSTTVGQRKGNTNERNHELKYLVIVLAIFLVLFIVIAIAVYHIVKLFMRKDKRTIVVHHGMSPLFGVVGMAAPFGSVGMAPLFGVVGMAPIIGGVGMSSLFGGDGMSSLFGGDDMSSLFGGDGMAAPFGSVDMSSLFGGDDMASLVESVEPLIAAVTTKENTDQKEIIEPVSVDTEQNSTTGTSEKRLNDVCSNNASTTSENGKKNINMELEPLIEAATTTKNTDQKEMIEPVCSNNASTTSENGKGNIT